MCTSVMAQSLSRAVIAPSRKERESYVLFLKWRRGSCEEIMFFFLNRKMFPRNVLNLTMGEQKSGNVVNKCM